MEMIVVLLVIVAVIVTSAWVARRVRRPEGTSSHDIDLRESTSERFYSDTGRPAGPDAEEPVGGALRFEDEHHEVGRRRPADEP